MPVVSPLMLYPLSCAIPRNGSETLGTLPLTHPWMGRKAHLSGWGAVLFFIACVCFCLLTFVDLGYDIDGAVWYSV